MLPIGIVAFIVFLAQFEQIFLFTVVVRDIKCVIDHHLMNTSDVYVNGNLMIIE